MDFIADTLPQATANNPPYLFKDGSKSVWLTQDVTFEIDASGDVHIAMKERFTQTRGAKTTQGRHEASFSLHDVSVTQSAASDYVAASGGPALELVFTCHTPGCILAKWDDTSSRADMTDISMQDAGLRARLLSAFLRLQSAP